MTEQALAVVFVVLAWWLSTAVVLRLVWLPRFGGWLSLTFASGLAGSAMVGATVLSEVDSSRAAYGAFVCALVLWGWHELAFLSGAVTGPRREPCPPGATGWPRFRYATAAVIHHEVALAATLLVLVFLTWGQKNQVTTGTFFVLWLMRISAKLNLFLGVAQVSDEFIPPRLRYLRTYFRFARLNPLMPVSLLLSAALTVFLGFEALRSDAGSLDATGASLVGTLAFLALLEHIFLAFSLPDALLWRWVIGSVAPADGPPAGGLQAPLIKALPADSKGRA